MNKQLTMVLASIAALAAPLLSSAEEITRTIDDLTVTADLETTGEGWTNAGTADTVVPGLIDAMAALTDAQNVRFEVLDGADHFFRDLWAEDIGDMSAEFVQSL